jgi:hypothetical protein
MVAPGGEGFHAKGAKFKSKLREGGARLERGGRCGFAAGAVEKRA